MYINVRTCIRVHPSKARITVGQPWEGKGDFSDFIDIYRKIDIYTYIHTYICIDIHPYYLPLSFSLYIYIHIHIHIHIYIYVYLYISIHIYLVVGDKNTRREPHPHGLLQMKTIVVDHVWEQFRALHSRTVSSIDFIY